MISPIHAKGGAVVLVLLLLLPGIYAAAGNNEGEIVLDSASNYQPNAYSSAIETGMYFIPGGMLAVKAFSALTNSFSAQYQNKEQGLNQNTELDVAKQNLEDSKDNVASMFFYIVATFVVLFDMIISIIYIAMLAIVIWIIFIGYVKFMIMLIDFVSGRIKKRRS